MVGANTSRHNGIHQNLKIINSYPLAQTRYFSSVFSNKILFLEIEILDKIILTFTFLKLYNRWNWADLHYMQMVLLVQTNLRSLVDEKAEEKNKKGGKQRKHDVF